MIGWTEPLGTGTDRVDVLIRVGAYATGATWEVVLYRRLELDFAPINRVLGGALGRTRRALRRFMRALKKSARSALRLELGADDRPQAAWAPCSPPPRPRPRACSASGRARCLGAFL